MLRVTVILVALMTPTFCWAAAPSETDALLQKVTQSRLDRQVVLAQAQQLRDLRLETADLLRAAPTKLAVKTAPPTPAAPALSVELPRPQAPALTFTVPYRQAPVLTLVPTRPDPKRCCT